MIWKSIVCLVTDRSRLVLDKGNDIDTLVGLAEKAAEAGVDLIQIREADLDDRHLIDLVSRIVERTAATSTRVLVNDRLDIALSTGAAGVHLRHDSLPAKRVREICPKNWLIGRSVCSVDEAQEVAKEKAVDYLIMGTIFESDSKPGVGPVGLDILREAVNTVEVPVIAIGGITTDKAELVSLTGAAGVAAIGQFAATTSPSTADLNQIVSKFNMAFRATDILQDGK